MKTTETRVHVLREKENAGLIIGQKKENEEWRETKKDKKNRRKVNKSRQDDPLISC
jgi:hypothetical protein